MKYFSFIVLLFIVAFAQAQKNTLLNELRLSNKTDNNRPVIVSLVNPRDCINCYPVIADNIRYVLDQNIAPRENLFFFMSKIRQVEKKSFLEHEMKGVLNGYPVEMNDTLFNAFFDTSPQLLRTSSLIIFDKNDSILFAGNYKSLDKQKFLKAVNH